MAESLFQAAASIPIPARRLFYTKHTPGWEARQYRPPENTDITEIIHIKHLYRHPEVRDLAWIMASPGLLDATSYAGQVVEDIWCQAILERNQHQLQYLDENPLSLQNWLAEHYSYRLGVYFEALLGYWLKVILQAEIYQHNVAVFRRDPDSPGRQTIGEFDFIFRLPGETDARHWEAAVKFYLRHQDHEGDIRWYGPAASDRLDIKVDRLFGHQLRLAECTAGREAINHYGIRTVKPAAFMKGYLFYPYQHWQDDFPDADMLSAGHLRGWWLSHGNLARLPASRGRYWVLLPRHQWLAPAYLQDSEFSQLLSRDDLVALCQKHFAQSDKALLFAGMQQDGDAWIEVERGFVVSELWP